MAVKDLHEKPFDESTISKLEMFEDYAQEWLAAFVNQNYSEISIFDFFAGTGYDKNKVEGSPIRILKKIKEQIPKIKARSLKVNLYLNEFKKGKFEDLLNACKIFVEENPELQGSVNFHFYRKDFAYVFPVLLPKIRQNPALVYLDQNGIKFLSDTYLLKLEQSPKTDFLYFLSSSYLWRFPEELKEALNIDIDAARNNPYKYIHKNIIKQLRSNLPSNTHLKLYPFTIKKDQGIYGIVFGAKHPLAFDKFLRVAWKKNPQNGEATFDIDDDASKVQKSLFGNNPLTKFERFEKNIREKVLNKDILNNKMLYDYSLEEGHLGSHAAKVLSLMKAEGIVTFDNRSPLVTYDKVYKEKQILDYTLLK